MNNKLDNKEIHKCEHCGKEHDGSYGSGRFCSKFCARAFSTSKNRKEITEKIKFSNKLNWKNLHYICKFCNRRFKNEEVWKNHEQKCTPENRKRINNSPIYREKFLKRYFERKLNIHGSVIDITQAELDEYRKTHTVCEICGKRIEDLKSKKNLSVDHDHSTLKFRGLLCMNCNANLGWYEKYQQQVNEYLDSHTK